MVSYCPIIVAACLSSISRHNKPEFIKHRYPDKLGFFVNSAMIIASCSLPAGCFLLHTAYYQTRCLRMRKLYDRPELIEERKLLRTLGKRVVFTNGCFDLLHPGHIRYLTEARALGDVLLVALNSDSSVKRIKGEGRPILNELERAEVMAGLECVDYVTIFDEETPRELIAALLPDVLVKGGDWPIDRIVGREEVEAAGGRVLSLPYIEGSSTTDIIERIISLNKDIPR